MTPIYEPRHGSQGINKGSGDQSCKQATGNPSYAFTSLSARIGFFGCAEGDGHTVWARYRFARSCWKPDHIILATAVSCSQPATRCTRRACVLFVYITVLCNAGKIPGTHARLISRGAGRGFDRVSIPPSSLESRVEHPICASSAKRSSARRCRAQYRYMRSQENFLAYSSC